MRMVRAVLIDPFARTVTEVEQDADNYRDIYTTLSHETMPVDVFTVFVPYGLATGDGIYVDDEGLLKTCVDFFGIDGYPDPLAGKGLVLGVDEEGETVSAKTTLAEIKKKVTFLNRIGRSFIPIPKAVA